MYKVFLCVIKESDSLIGVLKGYILKGIFIYNYWYVCFNVR